MRVYFVGAGPGDPELLTVKAQRLLKDCRFCIYAGSLVSPAVLELLPVQAERYDSAALDLDQIVELFTAARTRGLDVVRLHTGEPALFGAIGEQMDALDALGIDYEVVPGVSSFQAAAAELRVELTAPDIAQTVILTRVAGRTPVPEPQSIQRLAASQATLCLFLSVDKIDEIVATLAPHYGEDCPAAVVFRASWPDQNVVRGTIRDIAARVREQGISRTAMVLVGHALQRPLPHASRLYDPQFTHGYRRKDPDE